MTDKNGIPISAVITPASTHDIKAVTDVVENAVVNKQPTSPAITSKSKAIKQHLCIDRTYNSRAVEQETINGDTYLMRHTRERGVKRRQWTMGKRSKKIPSKKAMGCGEIKLMMAQQAREAACTA